MAVYPSNYSLYQQPNYLGYYQAPIGQQPVYLTPTVPLPTQQQNYSAPVAQQQQQQPQQNNGIIWVQGEAGAKSYIVGNGQSVLLMDSENSSFYVKSADASGVPMPLRVFDYVERGQQQKPHEQTNGQNPDYVTRDELKQWSDKLRASIVKEGRQDGRKSSV